MRNSGLPLFAFLLLLAAGITLACGSRSPVASNCSSTGTNDGLPESISLCPATANANDYPGQVQFTAIGYFNTQPSPAPLKVQIWGVCQQGTPTSAVSITTNGLAQCTAGASGAYQVFASDMTNCLTIGSCGEGCFVTGRATLTCP